MQQQFNQANQSQFFDHQQTNQSSHIQDNQYAPHEQQLLQQLGGIIPRSDDARQQMQNQQLAGQQMQGQLANNQLSHQMAQQFQNTQNSMQSQMQGQMYNTDANKAYQSLLMQQNMRGPGQNQQAVPPQAQQQTHLQNLMQNNKSQAFYPGQQQMPGQPSGMDLAQQQSLMQQMIIKNQGNQNLQNMGQSSTPLLTGFFPNQQISNHMSQQKSHHSEASQDQLRTVQSNQMQQIMGQGQLQGSHLSNNQQSLLMNANQGLLMKQRSQVLSTNLQPQHVPPQQRMQLQENPAMQQNQQLTHFFKMQQERLAQGKDGSQATPPISQILMQQQSYQQYQQNQANAQQNMLTSNSPHLAQQMQNQYNKQPMPQSLTQKLAEPNQNIGLAQLQNQQNLMQRQVQQQNLQPGMVTNQQMSQQRQGQPNQFSNMQQMTTPGNPAGPQRNPVDDKLDLQRSQQAMQTQAALSQNHIQSNLGQNLAQANLSQATIAQANHLQASLAQAGLTQANLTQANFAQSGLQQANLQQQASLSHNNHQQNLLNLMNSTQGKEQVYASQGMFPQMAGQQIPISQQSQQNQSEFVSNSVATIHAQNQMGVKAGQFMMGASQPIAYNQVQGQANQQYSMQTQNVQKQDNESDQQPNSMIQQFLPGNNGDPASRFDNIASLSLPKSNKLGGTDSASMLTFQNLGKLAEFCATRGDYPLAIEYYKHMTNLQPDNGPSWMALGHCCLLTDDIHQAFNAYQHALNCVEDIKDPQLWYGIGILYEKFESYDNAISALVGVLKMSPNFYQKSEVLYKLGIIFAKTNQINQAINYFQNSILTNSFTNKRKVDTLLKIGLLYEEKRDFAQAQRSYEAALSYNDKNHKVFQHLAWCNFQNNNIVVALDFIQKAEKREKENADSLYIKARCQLAVNNFTEAQENFSCAIEKTSSEPTYLISYAILLYEQGKYQEAFNTILKAQNLKPDNCEVWYNLGILYEKCNQSSEAIVAYTRVLEIDSKHKESKNRVNIINQQNNGGPRVGTQHLHMLHPRFNVPNTLQILRKYKNSSEEADLESVSPEVVPDQGNFQKINQQLNQIVQQQITTNNYIPQQHSQTPQQQEKSPQPPQNEDHFDPMRMNQTNMQIIQQRGQLGSNIGNIPQQNQQLQGQSNVQAASQQMQLLQAAQMQQNQFEGGNQNGQPVQSQSMQILQQSQRAMPHQYGNANQYQQQIQPPFVQNDQMQRLNEKIDAGQQKMIQQQYQQQVLDRNQGQLQQMRLQNNKNQDPMNDWEKHCQAQEQMLQDQRTRHMNLKSNVYEVYQGDSSPKKQGNTNMQFNLNISNPEIQVKQEENKKPDFPDKQHPDIPEASENPQFNFLLYQNELKDQKQQDDLNVQQNTYTQFIRNQQNFAQQLQKTFQEQPSEKPVSHNNFQIIQQHSVVRGPLFNQQQMRQMNQDNEDDGKNFMRNQMPDKGDADKPQDQLQDIILKQKLYSQMMDQQNQLQEANLEPKKDDYMNNQIHQMMSTKPHMAMQILHQRGTQIKKHVISNEDFVKKLYEVKENAGDGDYALQDHEKGVYHGSLHQKFEMPGDSQNGPNDEPKGMMQNQMAEYQQQQQYQMGNMEQNIQQLKKNMAEKNKDVTASESENQRNE